MSAGQAGMNMTSMRDFVTPLRICPSLPHNIGQLRCRSITTMVGLFMPASIERSCILCCEVVWPAMSLERVSPSRVQLRLWPRCVID